MVAYICSLSIQEIEGGGHEVKASLGTQETERGHEVKASLGYIARLFFKSGNQSKKSKELASVA